MRIIREWIGPVLLSWILLPFPTFAQAVSDDCLTEINGTLKGEAGSIQDHMFDSVAIDPTYDDQIHGLGNFRI
jgi:hypothetical protein